MKRLINQIQRSILILATLLMVTALGAPASVSFADSCDPNSGDQNGVHAPTGTDASTFTYQCGGQYAGKWTNQYYVYDPADGSRTALYDQAYQYDCTAHQWTALWWSYSPAQGSFYQSRIPADAPAGQATNCPVTPPAGSSSTSNSSSDPSSGNNGGSPQSSIGDTGTGSNNNVNNDNNLNSTVINNNTIRLHNGVVSQAASGNASVMGNTVGGDALSGDASNMASIANFLQSNSGIFGPDLENFVANINGDVNGDFMFDPSAIVNDTGTNSSNNANNNLKVNSNNTNNTDANITNNVDVGADSGNATVGGNTVGGNAKSGNAQAVVNLLNFINTSVAAGKSFIGTININGNLNGDILLPPDLVNQLLAATGANSSNNANTNVSDNSTTTNTNTTNIDNNIKSDAQSGNANVNGNTVGGTATSGKANTNVTLLNLTGSQVVGKNDILVFVNVLGHWVGMIMNAPAGSTAASLGGGISNTGSNSSNNANNNVAINDNNTNTNNFGIDNNVNVHAKSGDANVTGNTVGGSATSGNAKTAVNVLNLTGSNLNLANWFGILFINVFGNWTGSFGVNTSAGDPVAANSSSTTGDTSTAASGSTGAPFQFVPSSVVAGSSNRDATAVAASGSAGNTTSDGVVLAAKTIKSSAVATTPTQKAVNHLLIPIAGAAFAFLILFAGERKRFSKKS